MELKNKVINILKQAKAAFHQLAGVPVENKNKALLAMSNALLSNKRYILFRNKKDVADAKKKSLSNALIDRLTLTDERINSMAESLNTIAKLKDPEGAVLKQWKASSGIRIKKVRVPIGVIGIIYESRPNVTSDCAGLCLKSGNACVLKGGSEAAYSNIAIHDVLTKDIEKFGIPKHAVGMIKSTDRNVVDILLKQNTLVDLIIPRGGEGLIRHVTENSTIPVVKHDKGVCNLYVDKKANLKKALNITINAKTQKPGVCNAIENLLVHKNIARSFLPEAAKALELKGVELRGCNRTRAILKKIKKAEEKDWYEEYLDLILAVKVVDDLAEAIEFINKYGSGHSDAIVTEDKKAADEFLKRVDSACVYANASTRFTDGYQFGMGAEIGISTDKIHARGPMALEELCTYKYVVLGTGQVREQ